MVTGIQHKILLYLTAVFTASIYFVACGYFDNLEYSNTELNNRSSESRVVTAGKIVVSYDSLSVREDGGEAYFTVELARQPGADVKIPLSVGGDIEAGELLDAPKEIILTPDDWDKPQEHKITFKSKDNNIKNEDKKYLVILGQTESIDKSYHGLDPEDLTIVIQDTDQPNILVNNHEIKTNDDGSEPVKLEISLSKKPSKEVFVQIEPANGLAAIDGSSKLTFTPDNYSDVQTVSIIGQRDGDIADIEYNINLNPTTDSAKEYLKATASISAININISDKVEIIASPNILEITEGHTGTFTVNLNSRPTDKVVIYVMDPQENSDDFQITGVENNKLTFTNEDWDPNNPKTVNIEVIDDYIFEDQESHAIDLPVDPESSPEYRNLNKTVNINIQDSDDGGSTINLGGHGMLNIVIEPAHFATVDFGICDPANFISPAVEICRDDSDDGDDDNGKVGDGTGYDYSGAVPYDGGSFNINLSSVEWRDRCYQSGAHITDPLYSDCSAITICFYWS